MQLFLFPSIGNQLFYHIKIHEWLSSEEIHFKIFPVSGVCNQEIKCLFSCLIRHQGSSSMIFALFRKAIAACQIAVMCNM